MVELASKHFLEYNARPLCILCTTNARLMHGQCTALHCSTLDALERTTCTHADEVLIFLPTFTNLSKLNLDTKSIRSPRQVARCHSVADFRWMLFVDCLLLNSAATHWNGAIRSMMRTFKVYCLE